MKIKVTLNKDAYFTPVAMGGCSPKITAIKAVRYLTDMGLKEAKDTVEDVLEKGKTLTANVSDGVRYSSSLGASEFYKSSEIISEAKRLSGGFLNFEEFEEGNATTLLKQAAVVLIEEGKFIEATEVLELLIRFQD